MAAQDLGQAARVPLPRRAPGRQTAGGPAMTAAARRIEDLTGRRFGRWTVLAYAGVNKRRGARWTCLCDCGAHGIVGAWHLRSGQSQSCGCLCRIDLTGKRFGRLVVTAYAGNLNWFCACDCGARAVVKGVHLREGCTKSCGCLKRERTKARCTKHGMSGTPEYKSWAAMMRRSIRSIQNTSITAAEELRSTKTGIRSWRGLPTWGSARPGVL